MYWGEEMFQWLITVLLLLVFVLLLTALYAGTYRMVRIYNWNGKKYCYLGMVPMQREGKGFAVSIRESMVDLSHTTLYRLCPSRRFCRKHRYQDLFVYADGSRSYLTIEEEAMKTKIPF